jgi:hypothetical protein
MADIQFDPFGYRALGNLIAQGIKEIIAAVNNPAWLNPSAPPSTALAVTAAIFPPVVDVGGQVYAKLDAITANTVTILSDEGKDMAALDDLNAAVTALTTEVGLVVTNMNTLMTDLTAALAAANPTAIEAAVTGINSQVAALQAAVTADTPPP